MHQGARHDRPGAVLSSAVGSTVNGHGQQGQGVVGQAGKVLGQGGGRDVWEAGRVGLGAVHG
jgi:hypothetical protein